MYKITDLRTEQQIEYIKETFLQLIKHTLQLHNVFAPLFLLKGTGINDDLNGFDQPVSFTAAHTSDSYEIVQSLAKWKRIRLQELEVPLYQGIITRMTAIRPDEQLSPLHSLLVDQWDWEMAIAPSDRTIDFLESIVSKIYHCIYLTERKLKEKFSEMDDALLSSSTFLPEQITFVTAKELFYKYPDKTPKEREDIAARQYRAIFIHGIGDDLGDGSKHDGRAPDYDDWALNGDLLLWNDTLGRAIEISSMGIRVNEKSLERQLKISGAESRKALSYHKSLLENKLPQTIGGGIGQSRLAMFLLRKEHIALVQNY